MLSERSINDYCVIGKVAIVSRNYELLERISHANDDYRSSIDAWVC